MGSAYSGRGLPIRGSSFRGVCPPLLECFLVLGDNTVDPDIDLFSPFTVVKNGPQ